MKCIKCAAYVANGRKFIGIEIAKEYFDLAFCRIDAAERQKVLFEF